MARYIDADTLKQRIMNNWYTATEIMEDIDAEPTADVVDKERYVRVRENADILSDALSEYQSADMVEVVRCKDCKHWDTEWWVTVGDKHYCELIDGFRRENWFCADGERRDDD